MNQFEQFQAALVLRKVSDSIFSFTPHKIITMGQGGVVLTDNKKINDFLLDIKTFNRVKSETTYAYINKKKDISEKTNKLFTLILINLILLFFKDVKNWKDAKNNESHNEKFPKIDSIILNNITTFLQI